MALDISYPSFRDSVIVAIADEQDPPGLGQVNLHDLCNRHALACTPTWIEVVGGDMDKLGWGRDVSTLKERKFLINGAGLARAAEVREARKPESVSSKIKRIPRSDWIAIGALVVSLIAVFK